MLSPLLVGPILRFKCLCSQCISNTTRVCLKALEKHFFLLITLFFEGNYSVIGFYELMRMFLLSLMHFLR